MCGNSHVWTYTYTIDIPDFVLPADGASTVNCPADAAANTTDVRMLVVIDYPFRSSPSPTLVKVR
jgi:hypothetical protein